MKVLVRQFGLSFTAYLVWITAFISFAVIGYFSRKFIPDLILQIVFKYLTVVVAITWMFSYSVYTKLVDITDSAGLDYIQHRNLEVVVKKKVKKFWINAVILGLAGVILNVPNILREASICVPSFVYSLTFIALLLCAYFLFNSWAELEEIRQLKSKLKENQRREELRKEQLTNLSSDSSWENDSKLDGFRK